MKQETSHILADMMVASVEGRASPEDQDEIRAHLGSGCPQCRSEFLYWRRVVPALEAMSWPAPAWKERRKALKAFRRQAKAGKSQVSRTGWAWLIPLAALVTLLVLLAVPLQRTEVAFAASLEDVAGQVEVRLRPEGEWTTLSGLQSLPLGAEIRTGTDGRATLVFPDRNRILLGAGTTVRLNRINWADGQWRIDLNQLLGNGEYQVSGGASEYRILTPIGVLAATEGQFNVEANLDGSVQVNVGEGVVSVAGSAGVAEVSSGQSATFPPMADTTPTSTAEAGPPRIRLSATPPPGAQATEPSGGQEGNGQNNNSEEQAGDPSPTP